MMRPIRFLFYFMIVRLFCQSGHSQSYTPIAPEVSRPELDAEQKLTNSESYVRRWTAPTLQELLSGTHKTKVTEDHFFGAYRTLEEIYAFLRYLIVKAKTYVIWP